MNVPSPQIIIIAGANGAGKSALAPFLLRDKFGLTEYVNADAIALGLSAFRPESAALEAGRIMLRRLRQLADEGCSFAFETTLSTRSYAAWLRRLKQQGYNFHLLFIWLRSPELAVERVKERVSLGGHNVPEHIIRRRYEKGVRNFFSLYCRLADSWVVYDNSISGRWLRVAAGKRAVISVIEESLWHQFKEAAK
ncbi:MAG TPA: zeta toxin family protein [Pyrinomonadaceae bacterium]|jgi:predicted ABC-type ATPase